ncbi:transcription initiation factor TFIID subunit 11-like [Dipodomys spectabilis]|uniref:transcription initiation factor TFIID subunit 11-like n=1 Tax=Dipodomys spectabilis TaxID=105255 RepID=UPI001C53B1E9|nr:transcription initiation factor TFIID subunit 11-like [Dipodomys spectabilis]
MDEGESPADKSRETGESEETIAAPRDPGAADTEGAPEETEGDRDADPKMAAAEEGESRDASDLTATEREDTSLPTPAAKKLKIGTREKKERKKKVDEEEIQKMQILVSSFSEEQLSRYESSELSHRDTTNSKRWMSLSLGSVAESMSCSMSHPILLN